MDPAIGLIVASPQASGCADRRHPGLAMGSLSGFARSLHRRCLQAGLQLSSRLGAQRQHQSQQWGSATWLRWLATRRSARHQRGAPPVQAGSKWRRVPGESPRVPMVKADPRFRDSLVVVAHSSEQGREVRGSDSAVCLHESSLALQPWDCTSVRSAAQLRQFLCYMPCAARPQPTPAGCSGRKHCVPRGCKCGCGLTTGRQTWTGWNLRWCGGATQSSGSWWDRWWPLAGRGCLAGLPCRIRVG